MKIFKPSLLILAWAAVVAAGGAEALAAPGRSCLLAAHAAGRSCEDPHGLLPAGLKALRGSATGRGLLGLLKDGSLKISVQQGADVAYSDADDQIVFNPQSFEGDADWQTAVILAHELEHARQHRLGVTGPEARGYRELGAFFVQCRVWIELGGKARSADWRQNRMNSQDMWAWLEHPWSAAAALSLRGTFAPFAPPGSLPERYWDKTLSDEAAWRGLPQRTYPSGWDSEQAALFVLAQAARSVSEAYRGPVSLWLPAALEALARSAAGAGVPIPAAPSKEDAAVVAALPFPAAPADAAGAWRLTRF